MSTDRTRRWRLAAGIIGALGGLLIVGGLAWTWWSSYDEPPPDGAEPPPWDGYVQVLLPRSVSPPDSFGCVEARDTWLCIAQESDVDDAQGIVPMDPVEAHSETPPGKAVVDIIPLYVSAVGTLLAGIAGLITVLGRRDRGGRVLLRSPDRSES